MKLLVYLVLVLVVACSAHSSSDSLGLVQVTTISVTPSNLALSATGLITTTGSDSGTPRVFTITNTGSAPALNVTFLPVASQSITSILPSGCGRIAAGDSCTLTVRPSATPSAPVNNTTPTPVTLNISGDNTNIVSPTLNVLTYGSFYQAGFVFSITETANTSLSIVGSVVAQTDAAAQSTTEFSPSAAVTTSAMYSGKNGATNTQGMLTAYGTTQNYSAGYCIGQNYSAGGFTDWYLPSVCQWGYGAADDNFDCSDTTSPDYTPSIQENLLAAHPTLSFNFVNIGDYWSSTASESTAPNVAWRHQVVIGGGSGNQNFHFLNTTFGVRCARDLTQ